MGDGRKAAENMHLYLQNKISNSTKIN
jgi:hypothetical protein